VPAGPSRKAAGWPFTWSFNEGNCSLTQSVSRGLLPVSCSAGELIDDVPGGEVALSASSVVSHKGDVMRIGRWLPRNGDDVCWVNDARAIKALSAADPWEFQHLRFFGHPRRMTVSSYFV
jgi:hypothetical protein